MRHDGRRKASKIKGGTFAAVIRAFKDSPKFRGFAASTRDNYARVLRLAEQPEILGELAVDIIRPALVQAFLDGLEDRPGMQEIARTALKAVEKWALVRDLLPYPITTGTEVKGTDGGFEPWTDGQVELAERAASAHIARAVTLGVESGQRGSDLVRMGWSDLEEKDDPVAGIRRPGVHVTQVKTGVRLWVPCTRRLISKLEEWKRDRRPPFRLLTDALGRPYSRKGLTQAWRRGCCPI